MTLTEILRGIIAELPTEELDGDAEYDRRLRGGDHEPSENTTAACAFVRGQLTVVEPLKQALALAETQERDLAKPVGASVAPVLRTIADTYEHGPNRGMLLEAAGEIGRLAAQLAAEKQAREKAEAALARLELILDECGKLSTGWKHGNEGVHLLKINSLLSGNGTGALDAALENARRKALEEVRNLAIASKCHIHGNVRDVVKVDWLSRAIDDMIERAAKGGGNG